MKMKKIVVAILTITLSISLLSINAEDFSANEAYYQRLCSSSAARDKENKLTCQKFNVYLEQKISNSKDEANKYKGEMEKYKNDMNKQIELADEYQAKIDGFTAEISKLESEIRGLEASIKVIEAEILAREEEIAEKDRIIIERMRKTQSDMRFGYEIDFLFKSKDFSTLIAAASIVNDILDFESIQIEEINKLIEQQKVDQEVMLTQQATIELNINTIEVSKKQVEVLKSEVDIAVKNYQTLMNDMNSKMAQSNADANAIRKQLEKNKSALEEVPSSGGFTRPISGGRVSARVWNYPPPWSAVHLGYDYASGIGTPIRAAANGYVLSSRDGCPTNGYLGNQCGGGSGGLIMGGNQVHLLVTVGGILYGISYSHMQLGTPIKSGQIVSAGQQIGAVGNSGNSTGPHVHVEVIYLGNRSINDYINSWNGNLWHNVGSSLNNRCSVKGFNAPCRVDPGTVFGRN